jgi:hypothetical protein
LDKPQRKASRSALKKQLLQNFHILYRIYNDRERTYIGQVPYNTMGARVRRMDIREIGAKRISNCFEETGLAQKEAGTWICSRIIHAPKAGMHLERCHI